MHSHPLTPLLTFARAAFDALAVEVELDEGTVMVGAPTGGFLCERALPKVLGLVRVTFPASPAPGQERLVESLAATVATLLRSGGAATPGPAPSRDLVTGLPDRPTLLANAAARLRDGTGRAVTLLALDLDALPEIGEHLGRAAVEHALKTLSEVIRRAVRGTDVVGHLTGQVILVLLPDCDERAAGMLVQRIRDVLANATPHGWPELQVDVGSITAREAEPDLTALIELADASLFVDRRSRRARLRAV
jgi:diguanylate cyclase (GGDEF)-like protein